ncbi:hypothetical protein CB1_000568069 [Camelus ferus]|nr:hypothetical protein CB1_000568069 [Camelus ferus]
MARSSFHLCWETSQGFVLCSRCRKASETAFHRRQQKAKFTGFTVEPEARRQAGCREPSAGGDSPAGVQAQIQCLQAKGAISHLADRSRGELLVLVLDRQRRSDQELVVFARNPPLSPSRSRCRAALPEDQSDQSGGRKSALLLTPSRCIFHH